MYKTSQSLRSPPEWSRRAAWGGRRSVFACCLLITFVPADARAQDSLHGFHPIMPGQRLYFRCWSASATPLELKEVPLSLSSVSMPSKLKQRVEFPDPWPAVQLVEFLPAAVLKQDVVADADGTGRAAVELTIAGPKQSTQRWLIVDDPARNRLTSLIATWRLMAVTGATERNELLRQFREELTREPKLRVKNARTGIIRETAVQAGAVQALDDLGCSFVVKRFYPHFARDHDAAEPVNLSEKRVNPAALVEIRQGDVSEQRWVFAKFPSFRRNEGEQLPFDVKLDCPVQSSRALPDFALVAVDRDKVEVWTRHDGSTHVRAVSVGDSIEIPGSNYVFRIARFEPSGRLVEVYEPAPKGVPALAVTFPSGDGTKTTTWLVLGKYRTVETPAGPLTVGFDQTPPGGSGRHP